MKINKGNIPLCKRCNRNSKCYQNHRTFKVFSAICWRKRVMWRDRMNLLGRYWAWCRIYDGWPRKFRWRNSGRALDTLPCEWVTLYLAHSLSSCTYPFDVSSVLITLVAQATQRSCGTVPARRRPFGSITSLLHHGIRPPGTGDQLVDKKRRSSRKKTDNEREMYRESTSIPHRIKSRY